jgi:hypothetical protein
MIGPVETQHSILQSPTTEKVQSVQQQQSDTQQRYFNMQLAEERRLQREKIRSMEEEKPELVKNALEREEKREMRNNHRQKGTHASEEQNLLAEEEEWYDEPLSGGYIDVKV